MQPLVKIFGERNTGTNYLDSLVSQNTDATHLRGTPPRLVNALFRRYPLLPGREEIENAIFAITSRRNLGWKHAVPMPAANMADAIGDRHVIFITLTKNPYPWLLSLYDKPYGYYRVWEDKPSFHEFLNSTPPVLGRENGGDVPLSSPMDVWNRKNGRYLSLADIAPTYNMRYESLVADPEGEMRRMCDATGLRLSETFVNREDSTKSETKTFDFYQQRYLSEEWRDELTDADLKVINANLDRTTLEAYDYSVIDPDRQL